MKIQKTHPSENSKPNLEQAEKNIYRAPDLNNDTNSALIENVIQPANGNKVNLFNTADEVADILGAYRRVKLLTQAQNKHT